MRIQIAAANWKMNLTVGQAEILVNEILQTSYPLSDKRIVILGVPFPYLSMVKEKLKGHHHIYVAAQNCSDKKSGAYTGEVSAEMLRSIGVEYVIIGHSERRAYYHEDDQLLAAKVNVALEFGLTPIFCCGEPLDIWEAGSQDTFVAKQLEEGLFHLSADQLQKIVIAYEPIWAIGTGKTATTEQAEQMHAHLRNTPAKKYGNAAADTVSILYGGSVKASNAGELFAAANVDGGLVGGASLVAKEFSVIINSLK